MKGYILSLCRTPVGSFGGCFKGVSAAHLASIAIKEALNRGGILPEQVDEIVMGNVLQAGQGQNTARQAAVAAGVPIERPAMTINKVCGSGLRSISLACQIIAAGDADCVVAGGMENMSQVPYLLKGQRWGTRMGDVISEDYMVKDGLWDVFNDYHMGITAENVAAQYNVTREEQDAFAYESQMKATKASSTGRFQDEIVSVPVKQKKESMIVSDDEYIRPNTTPEVLSKLRPAFKADGTVTAGNASGINDGAAAAIVVSENFLKKNHLVPIAEIVSYGSVGVDPSIMGIGPVPSIRQALSRAKLNVSEIDLFEINEAFAAQAIAVQKELKIPAEKLNVNGGAIAIGHPIGGSGARILVSLIYEMKKRGTSLGLASLCIGGGMGEALVVKCGEK